MIPEKGRYSIDIALISTHQRGLYAQYYHNPYFSGLPVSSQIVDTIDFEWNVYNGNNQKNYSQNVSPDQSYTSAVKWSNTEENNQPMIIISDLMSIRWTGYLEIPYTGRYEFEVSV